MLKYNFQINVHEGEPKWKNRESQILPKPEVCKIVVKWVRAVVYGIVVRAGSLFIKVTESKRDAHPPIVAVAEIGKPRIERWVWTFFRGYSNCMTTFMQVLVLVPRSSRTFSVNILFLRVQLNIYFRIEFPVQCIIPYQAKLWKT